MQRADDLHAFDGINAQLGFQVLVQTQHVFRVAGAVGDDGQQSGADIRGRLVGGGRRRGRRQARDMARLQGDRRIQNGLQAAGLGVALHVGLHLCCRLVGQRLLQLAENLHSFDGVDAQLGFQILVQAQHVLGVAGELGDNGQQAGLEINGLCDLYGGR